MSVYVMMGLSFVPLLLFLVVFCLAVPGFRVRYGLVSTLVGLFSLIPIVVAQYLVLKLPVFASSSLVGALIAAMVFNGLVEETVKMFTLLLLPHKRIRSGVFFAMSLISGLALGCFETVIYLFSGYHNIEIRSLTAVAMHGFCAGLSGIYVWTWRNPVEKSGGKKTSLVMPFVLAVLLHGVYNFFAGFRGGFWWFSIVALLMAALECRIWYKKVAGDDEPSLV